MDFNDLRHHIPDMSDTSMAAGPSEPSFQIPNAVGSSSQLLLEDDCADFLAGMESTLNTPTPPSSQEYRDDNPLTLAELTPRSSRTKVALRYTPSFRKPAIQSPLKHVAAQDLGTTIEDTLEQTSDITFQIPRIANDVTQLLSSENDLELFSIANDYSILDVNRFTSSAQPHEVLTFSQLAPAPAPKCPSSSSNLDTSAEKSSQHSVAASFAALKTQIEDLSGDNYNPDRSVHEFPSDATTSLEVPPETRKDVSPRNPVDCPEDQGPRGVGILEESSASSTRSIPLLGAPEPPVRLSGRRSTGKQTVISGGILKRSRLAGPSSTNALRSKAIGKRSGAMQGLTRKHDVSQQQKTVPANFPKATLPIRVTLKKANNISRKAVATRAASSSHRQPINIISSTVDDKSNFTSLLSSTHIFQTLAFTMPNVKKAYEDSTAVQPLRITGNETSITSTAVDRDLDQALDDAGIMTHNQVFPSDTTRFVATINDSQPKGVHYADNDLSTKPDSIELERDGSGTTSTSSLAPPPSPLRRSSKRAAPDAPEYEVQTQAKRVRSSHPPQERSDGVTQPNDGLNNSTRSEKTRPTTRVLRSSRVKNITNAHVPALTTSKSGPSVSRTAKRARTVEKPGVATRTSSRPHTVNTGVRDGRTRRAHQLTTSSSSAPDESGGAGSVALPTSSSTRSADSETTVPQELVLQRSFPFTQTTGSANLNDQYVPVNRAGSSQGHARLVSRTVVLSRF
ncbi:hypothetical protein BDY19DRAFT_64862 [Irpex rosettiformis]|uniref:Uncharacterized protein n=1 Tax=Irpex rosettiformis TaxID=378272 RepID=A0ACB8UMV3_9APHY|nr:hypothetical protein BDY19DRAFT_64862 [Irpex rosettiformis]